MFCRKCGNKTDAQDKFCANCGEPVANGLEEPAVIVPEPPKDLVWNIEGYPTDKKEKKVEEVIFDWKADNQGKDFAVDNFYVDDRQNISAQRQLDKEVEKINSNSIAREEAILRARISAEEEKTLPEQETKIPEILTPETVAPETVAPETVAPETEMPEAIVPVILAVTMEEKVEHVNEANKTELKYDDIFVEEEEENEAKGFTFGKFILTIVIILILLECAFLGLKYFMPENPTVIKINEQVTQAVLTAESWFVAKEPVKESQPVEQPKVENPVVEEPVAAEPANPYPDNVNIKEITVNPNLAYISGKDYGDSDINQSLPATENTDSVVDTIVSYDSKWIDYVNNGDKSVLALTAKGSQAEKNTLAFTNVGKIKETFNSLEIGEVRKGSKGYYIWVREEIIIQENGIDTEKIYRWIYQVSPIENEMKIVNYFSYK